jgi:hypothetical protein
MSYRLDWTGLSSLEIGAKVVGDFRHTVPIAQGHFLESSSIGFCDSKDHLGLSKIRMSIMSIPLLTHWER